MNVKAKQRRIFLSPPDMGGEELSFIQEAFKSNYIAPLGPMVDAFEQDFSDKVGIFHALAVSSGTAAMPQWNSFLPVKSISSRKIIGGHVRRRNSTRVRFHGVNIWH